MKDNDTIDARLVAYLDGQLSAEQTRALEADLASDAALSDRLAALDVDLGGLSTSMTGLLAEAPAMPQIASARRVPFVQLALAASVALALLLGGVAIGARSGGAGGDWRDFAAAYHLLYRPETLAEPIMGDGGVTVVSDALGRDLSAFADIEGLDFRRAQVLGWDTQALVQFAYLDAQGRPIAVCFILNDAVARGFEDVDRHGLPTVSFQQGPFEVMVIGADGVDNVDQLAQAVAARL